MSLPVVGTGPGQGVEHMGLDEFWIFVEAAYGYALTGLSLQRRTEIWEHRSDPVWLWEHCDEIHTLIFHPEDWGVL